ncbi:MAG: hypothetical protein II500_04130 [Campylobacter sp.]|nr:hypothetical protein [Campylobacter sp.]
MLFFESSLKSRYGRLHCLALRDFNFTARKIAKKYFALVFCFSNLCKFYGFCKFYILMPTIFRVVKQISVSDKAGMPIEGEICERSEKLG